MQAGRYNKIIDILRKKVTINDFGEHEQGYEKNYSTKAYVEYNGGGRTNDEMEMTYIYGVKFTVRSYVDVQDDDLIEYQHKQYRILSIEDRSDDPVYNDKIITTTLVNE